MYINTYIWNLAGWCCGTSLQSSNGDEDIEDRLMGKGWGEEGEGEVMERAARMHVHFQMLRDGQGDFAV